MTSPRILLLGDVSVPEMPPLVEFLKRAARAAEFREAADIAAVRRLSRDATWQAELIVAFQSWSDQFTAADVLELLEHFPLSRLVACLGNWCDADGRTRTAWPLAACVRAAAARARLEQELARLVVPTIDHHASPPPFLPLTASRGEIFAADLANREVLSLRGKCVGLASPDRAFAQMLAASLRQAGATVLLENDAAFSEAALILCDIDPWGQHNASKLTALRGPARGRPIIACAGFVNDDLQSELGALGISRLWFKLDSLTRLHSLVADLTGAVAV